MIVKSSTQRPVLYATVHRTQEKFVDLIITWENIRHKVEKQKPNFSRFSEWICDGLCNEKFSQRQITVTGLITCGMEVRNKRSSISHETWPQISNLQV